jgi:4-amino-4-deoxychorismate lyase
MTIWINGRSGGCVDARDRGLHYGDGVFETMRVRRRGVRLLEYHLERLFEGCARLSIEAPRAAVLRRELQAAARLRPEGVLKLIVTRGPGERGYRPTGREPCTRILSLDALAGAAAAAIPVPWRLRLCATRLGRNPRLAGLKTLNRLESVLARSEWSDPRIQEGLMLDGDDNIVCGTMSNLFLLQGSSLVTPLLDRCGIAGVMRRWVLEQAAATGLRTSERRVRLRDLHAAGEIFMTNAVSGPVPVSAVKLKDGSLRPPSRAIALQLRARLDAT